MVKILRLIAEVLGHARTKREDIGAVVESDCGRAGICGINDYSRLIGEPFVRSAKELIGHRAGQGTRYVFLDSRVVPRTSLYTIVREVHEVVGNEPSHVDFHSHNCDSAFLFIGNGKNLKGLVCDVGLGDRNLRVESPSSVFIPAGLDHSYKLISGSGYYVNIVLSPDYNSSVQSPTHLK